MAWFSLTKTTAALRGGAASTYLKEAGVRATLPRNRRHNTDPRDVPTHVPTTARVRGGMLLGAANVARTVEDTTLRIIEDLGHLCLTIAERSQRRHDAAPHLAAAALQPAGVAVEIVHDSGRLPGDHLEGDRVD